MTNYICPYCHTAAPKSMNWQAAIEHDKPGMCVRCERVLLGDISYAPIRLGQHMRPVTMIKGVSIE